MEILFTVNMPVCCSLIARPINCTYLCVPNSELFHFHGSQLVSSTSLFICAKFHFDLIPSTARLKCAAHLLSTIGALLFSDKSINEGPVVLLVHFRDDATLVYRVNWYLQFIGQRNSSAINSAPLENLVQIN